MTGNCGLPEGGVHMHSERCYEAGRRDERAVVAERLAAAEATEKRVRALHQEWESWAKERSTTRIDAFRDAAESLATALRDEPPAEEVPC